VTLSIDASTDKTTNVMATNEIVTRDVEPDQAQTELVGHLTALPHQLPSAPSDRSRTPLARQLNGAGEGALGDVIADAYLSAARLSRGADIAFMNEGGVRADLTSTAVSYNDLFNVLPFGNTVLAMTVDGRTLKDLLEQQFDNPSPGRSAILQVSAGFTYRYALHSPSGRHVDAASIMLNGKRVLSGDRVRIATNDFLHTGGTDSRCSNAAPTCSVPVSTSTPCRRTSRVTPRAQHRHRTESFERTKGADERRPDVVARVQLPSAGPELADFEGDPAYLARKPSLCGP
jgi:5'-nucleotidase